MEYRYFLNEFLTERDLYRCPKNDQDFVDNITAVEYFDPDLNNWTKDEDKVMSVRNEVFTGWFSDSHDEISETKALQIIDEFKKRK